MAKSDNEDATLTLTGEGQVRARPDVANIGLGVVTTAKTAAEAVQDNAARMSAVVKAIKAIGIPDEDLQTVGFSISPVMDWDEKSPTHGQIVGYRVEDTLSVRAGVEQAGRVLDDGVAAGANVGGNLSFGLRNERPARDQALKGAVQAAKHDADIVAKAMGVKLKGAKTAEVMYGGSPVIFRSAVAKGGATPIEPGNLTISASVRIVYRY